MAEEFLDGITVNDLSVIYRVSIRTVYRILAENEVKYKKPRSRKRYTKPKRKAKKIVPLQPCGTNAAYQRHRKHGEYPCTPCLEAHAANVEKAKRKRKK